MNLSGLPVRCCCFPIADVMSSHNKHRSATLPPRYRVISGSSYSITQHEREDPTSGTTCATQVIPRAATSATDPAEAKLQPLATSPRHRAIRETTASPPRLRRQGFKHDTATKDCVGNAPNSTPSPQHRVIREAASQIHRIQGDPWGVYSERTLGNTLNLCKSPPQLRKHYLCGTWFRAISGNTSDLKNFGMKFHPTTTGCALQILG